MYSKLKVNAKDKQKLAKGKSGFTNSLLFCAFMYLFTLRIFSISAVTAFLDSKLQTQRKYVSHVKLICLYFSLCWISPVRLSFKLRRRERCLLKSLSFVEFLLAFSMYKE